MKPVPRSTKVLLAALVFTMMAALSASLTRVWLDGIEPKLGPMAFIGPPDEHAPSEKRDLIRVAIPRPGDAVSSPLRIEGEARGYWFFEAEFPIVLLDGDGDEVAVHYATAIGEWMTEDFVPFASTLVFDPPSTENGTLVLMRANASGLPEHDDHVRFRVRFGEAGGASPSEGEGPDAEPEPEPERDPPPSASGCFRTGCSGQVCADEEVVTTCEFRPEYACFKDARCERQSDGECGWTPTLELQACLQDTGIGAGARSAN